MWSIVVSETMGGEANDDARADGEVPQPNGERPRRPILEGTVVRYDDEPDECTLHPADLDRKRTTAWITAKEGSYVSAAAWR